VPRAAVQAHSRGESDRPAAPADDLPAGAALRRELAGRARNRYLHSIGPALLAASSQAMHKFLAVSSFPLLFGCLLLAAPSDDKPYKPHVAVASDEGEKALQRIRV